MAQEGVASSSEDEDSTSGLLEEDSLEEGEDSSLEVKDSSVEEGESLEEDSSIEVVEEALSSEEGTLEEETGSPFPQEARRREALSKSRREKDDLFIE